MSLIESIRKKLKLPAAVKNQQDGNFHRTEKAVVFIFAYIMALGMWMLINLDRDFTMNIELPLIYGEFPENLAPVESLPESVRASVSGEGWKLLNLYGSAPRISVDINDERVNLLTSVQNQLPGQTGLTVNQVFPGNIRIRLEEKIARQVPISPNIDIEFRRQFNIVGKPEMFPDSITVTGARSLVENIRSWPTKKVTFSDLNQSIDIMMELEASTDLVRLSDNRVNYRATVSEFTEGETRVPVVIRGGTESRNFSLSPSSILIRYDIPISQYTRAQDEMLFDAYVDFSDILDDATGFVTPNVKPLTKDFDLRVRSLQPQRVSYFQILQN
jgi:hypothetical protein